MHLPSIRGPPKTDLLNIGGAKRPPKSRHACSSVCSVFDGASSQQPACERTGGLRRLTMLPLVGRLELKEVASKQERVYRLHNLLAYAPRELANGLTDDIT